LSTSISACRICGNENLVKVVDLGEQTLTGVFPKSRGEPITRGPLCLVKCSGEGHCGLLQLQHSYSLDEMYGENYGYRSGLNDSMVAHLRSKVKRIEALGLLQSGDLVLDIGSNDGTTLKQYEVEGLSLVGMDPTGAKFGKYYPEHITLVADFFSADNWRQHFGERNAQVITSFSMFYDLEDPMAFVREIADILADNGVWIFEQSYMPLMLETNSYDTICHEHLEYYALSQITWMMDRVGLRVVDVEKNDVNGGSFSITVQKNSGQLPVSPSVAEMVRSEQVQKLDDLSTYFEFAENAKKSRDDLLGFLKDAKNAGKTVVALGASTKGNVVLQYCGIDSSLVACVGEVNPDKFGSFTPGTLIPIVDEQEVLAMKPDYAIVLPWHFRRYFESQQRYADLNLVYPLPALDCP
jgi:NDP-4-keto-2,6-dideoxyhexose 3-C-methyltransferase